MLGWWSTNANEVKSSFELFKDLPMFHIKIPRQSTVSYLFYNLIQSELLLPLRLNYSECKTKIFWCVPGFLLEFVLLNLLLFCVPGSEETTTDCIYIVIFFFAKCDLASVTLFTRLPTHAKILWHKSIQLCCWKLLKFCFICIFFQEPFKT